MNDTLHVGVRGLEAFADGEVGLGQEGEVPVVGREGSPLGGLAGVRLCMPGLLDLETSPMVVVDGGVGPGQEGDVPVVGWEGSPLGRAGEGSHFQLSRLQTHDS